MAAGQHNPSRRALLGAAVVLPLMGSALASSFPRKRESPFLFEPARRWTPDQVRGDGGSEAPSAVAWREALDAYQAAEAEVEDAEAWPADHEDEYSERLDSLCDALRHLLRTPAPDLRALAIKIDLAIEHELGTLAGAAACLAAIREDTQRLAAAYPGF
jgi:hypothetical protein